MMNIPEKGKEDLWNAGGGSPEFGLGTRRNWGQNTPRLLLLPSSQEPSQHSQPAISAKKYFSFYLVLLQCGGAGGIN